MAKRLRDGASDEDRAAAFRELNEKALFGKGQLRKMAKAARLPCTPEFSATLKSAAFQYLGWRRRRKEWTPSLAIDELNKLSAAAKRLERLLRKLPQSVRFELSHGARVVEIEDLNSGRLTRTTDRMPRLLVAEGPPGQDGSRMDVDSTFWNPGAVYPIEVLRRAAAEAAGMGRVKRKFDEVAIAIRVLSKGLGLPLTVTVTSGGKDVEQTSAQTTGRLVELAVMFLWYISRLKLPFFKLPDRGVALTADGVRKGINRAKAMATWTD